MIGYFFTPVFSGSNSLNSGSSVKQYCNSPNDDSKPAPNAFNSPCWRHKPYSTVNQKHYKKN